MAEVIPDARDPRRTKHTAEDILGQRIFQIACGYEDANDCAATRFLKYLPGVSRKPGIRRQAGRQ
jgi:hypothetical protein